MKNSMRCFVYLFKKTLIMLMLTWTTPIINCTFFYFPFFLMPKDFSKHSKGFQVNTKSDASLTKIMTDAIPILTVYTTLTFLDGNDRVSTHHDPHDRGYPRDSICEHSV